MSLSPVRFGQVHKIPYFTPNNLAALNAAIKSEENVVPHFVSKPPSQGGLGQVVVFTGQDAKLAKLNKQNLYDYRKILPFPGVQFFSRFRNDLNYRYTRQLVKRTHAQSPQELNKWYLKTPIEKIQELHTFLNTWLTQHEKRSYTTQGFYVSHPTIDPEAVFDMFHTQESALTEVANNRGFYVNSNALH